VKKRGLLIEDEKRLYIFGDICYSKCMAKKEVNSKGSVLQIVMTVLLVGAAFAIGSMWTELRVMKNKKAEVPVEQEKVLDKKEEEKVLTVGNFVVIEKEICYEEEKPIIYMFGSSNCPHCTWEHPIFEKVVALFGDKISVRDNMDNTTDSAVFEEYSDINGGAIPFMLFGCRYTRLGSGERSGEAEEVKNLTAIICRLTNGEPGEVCDSVSELVEKIKIDEVK